jgi:hypothetical protein
MEKAFSKIKAYWSQKNHYDKLIISGSIIFLGVAAFFIVAHGVFFTPDQFYALGFIFALITGQATAFLWDWTPLILVILSYEYLRGLIPLVNHKVHFNLMWKFDVLLFGRVPSVVLQHWFFNANHIHWYDYVATILYLMHYVTPMIVGYVFWQMDRKYFKEYVIGIVALSYLTFLTYLIFPAAPPWIAAQQGNIPPLQHVTTIVLSHMFSYVAVPTVYGWFGANLYAAVPSLHAAFPLLTALFIGKKWPKVWPILVVYVLAVWVAVIYLGEHYVFDVLLGAIYALFVYAVIYRAKAYLLKRWQLKKARLAHELVGE